MLTPKEHRKQQQLSEMVASERAAIEACTTKAKLNAHVKQLKPNMAAYLSEEIESKRQSFA